MNIAGLIQRMRRLRFATQGVNLDRSSLIGPAVSISRGSKVTFGVACELSSGVVLDAWGGHIRIGNRVFIGPHCTIYGQGGVEIGDLSLIAMHCCILSSNHAIDDLTTPIRDLPDLLLPTKIGRDVWLGAGVKVLGGIEIGDGCVVGAGSIVTKSLPPRSVAMGAPAKVVRMRGAGSN